MKNLSRKRLQLLIGLVLTVATLAVYGPVRKFDFVNLDDPQYVYENAHVQRGLSWGGVGWAFTTGTGGHWHPLTWLSLMADAQWYGSDAGGFHVTNLLLHVANTLLLFLILQAMTGALWRSAFVAALFALHPLRVESVAWVTERKDVLSGLFWLLTMGAYLRYVKTERGWWYGLTILCLALGLMAKPMLVTLPFVLLLLDHWPLRRAPSVTWPRLVLEKIPLFVLVAVSSGITLIAQQEAMATVENLGVGARIANAVVAYETYLQKMIWPTGLACFYPHPRQWNVLTVFAASALLAGLTLLAVTARKRAPAMLVGWCWYVGTLVPVSGLVQVGNVAFADRFTYLPLVGVWIALAWGLYEWAAGRRGAEPVLAAAAAAAVCACALVTWRLLPTWKNTETLARHALNVTRDNALAHNLLGNALGDAGHSAEAISHYQRALRIKPNDAVTYYNLAIELNHQGCLPEAIGHYEQALRIRPEYIDALNNLGNARLQAGQVAEALRHYEEALRIEPDSAKAHNNLGNALTRVGRIPKAIQHLEQALRFKPDYAEAHNNLGVALVRATRFPEAIRHLEHALRIKPEYAESQNKLARMLATADNPDLRDGVTAVRLAQRIVELSGPRRPDFLDTLAAAYAEAGRWPEAVATAEEAVVLAQSASRNTLAAQIQSRLDLYRGGRPYRAPPGR